MKLMYYRWSNRSHIKYEVLKHQPDVIDALCISSFQHWICARHPMFINQLSTSGNGISKLCNLSTWKSTHRVQNQNIFNVKRTLVSEEAQRTLNVLKTFFFLPFSRFHRNAELYFHVYVTCIVFVKVFGRKSHREEKKLKESFFQKDVFVVCFSSI